VVFFLYIYLIKLKYRNAKIFLMCTLTLLYFQELYYTNTTYISEHKFLNHFKIFLSIEEKFKIKRDISFVLKPIIGFFLFNSKGI